MIELVQQLPSSSIWRVIYRPEPQIEAHPPEFKVIGTVFKKGENHLFIPYSTGTAFDFKALQDIAVELEKLNYPSHFQGESITPLPQVCHFQGLPK